MSPEAQEDAIAVVRGWLPPGHPESKSTARWQSPNGSYFDAPPPYTRDLNAICQVVGELSRSQRISYGKHLMEVCMEHPVGTVPGDYHSDVASVVNITQATAAQRAESFLRTLNLWKES